ncbi:MULTISPECIES: hypothetical protein [Halorubrum]|uniref:Uncharacterized protein n=1 Tax=Halorubrum hochstenium ATCC 700873 TaxID=1227481 RepID=M0FQK8_9EURY|nr:MULTISPECIES: hypothetical protein [Halorubrum]ELZ61532.1 hypothetical protein C467_00826 [Halorubrum hochstenium ATCC 700873]
MNDPRITSSNRRAVATPESLVGGAAVVLGGAVALVGVLLLPASPLGGVHVVAIGLSLVVGGVLAADLLGDRLGLSTAGRRQWALAFGVLAVLLAVAFVAVYTFSSEGPVEVTEITTTASALGVGVVAPA